MTTTTPADQSAGPAEAAARLSIAMRDLYRPFLAEADRLRDMPSMFWVWLGILSGKSSSDRPGTLIDWVNSARAVLGAPGDFGYGTPCGDAIKKMYDAHDDLVRALEAAKRVTTGPVRRGRGASC